MHSVLLQSETDFSGWRNAARQLLVAGIAPHSVIWRIDQGMPDLFDALPFFNAAEAAAGTDASQLRDAVQRVHAPPFNPASSLNQTNPCNQTAQFKVPASFIALCRTVILHSDPAKFGLLYRLLWRMQVEPRLMGMALDHDVHLCNSLAQAIRRDMHKMKAFVRFREVYVENEVQFIAWFEPQHHIAAAVAPFFCARFSNMQWSILTPAVSLHYRQGELQFGPGGKRQDAPLEDAAEALWCSYYRSIFNPARLKVKAMQAEMPKKYWHNLPETALIPELIASAGERTAQMIHAQPQATRRKTKPYQRPPPVIHHNNL